MQLGTVHCSNTSHKTQSRGRHGPTCPWRRCRFDELALRPWGVWHQSRAELPNDRLSGAASQQAVHRLAIAYSRRVSSMGPEWRSATEATAPLEQMARSPPEPDSNCDGVVCRSSRGRRVLEAPP